MKVFLCYRLHFIHQYKTVTKNSKETKKGTKMEHNNRKNGEGNHRKVKKCSLIHYSQKVDPHSAIQHRGEVLPIQRINRTCKSPLTFAWSIPF